MFGNTNLLTYDFTISFFNPIFALITKIIILYLPISLLHQNNQL
jgi:hypothetical protein